MTVLDSSAVIDFLLGASAAREVGQLLADGESFCAPDVIVFEVLAALRRHVQRGGLSADRARGAVEDLGDLQLELFPSLVLRARAWELRENLAIADGLFAALAEQLREPLVTKDRGLAAIARDQLAVAVVELN
ncbi:type II toxin-antitoxin system VapC family toxin [Conexibacter sp. CPCC 206217]|uniref:type II toxin-antitoxin system VapC family toxin n=1 Tax=Conexibacter sp. CPCC 206217 TaxID=3064574 RepID=UPI00271EFC71|nr:type II toxin-antitoxin system VapC family toxin [Conexibacter sp. CPCC 206217]MDO8212762.1 type II toxin-antitoxin system VapC family toxin [Conexibacter sp. CPCC 206217]